MNLTQTRKIIFDKNTNEIVKNDELFQALFDQCITLRDLTSCIIKGECFEERFLEKLIIKNIHYQFIYKTKDEEDKFTFTFFLLPCTWNIINTQQHKQTFDFLTQTYTKEHLLLLLNQELKWAVRDKKVFSIALIDITHLRNINEMLGKDTGDYTIKRLGQLFKENTRDSDIVGRYGGDKFLLVLHKTDIYGTILYLEKIENAFKEINFVFNDLNFDVEISFGITMSKEEDSTEDVLKRCTDAVNEAKKSNKENIKYVI